MGFEEEIRKRKRGFNAEGTDKSGPPRSAGPTRARKPGFKCYLKVGLANLKFGHYRWLVMWLVR